MRLTQEEKTFIVTNFKVFNSYTILRRKFCSQFKKKHAPVEQTVKNLMKKFEKIGSVSNLPSTWAPKTVITDEKIEEVRLIIKNNPGMSLRRVS